MDLERPWLLLDTSAPEACVGLLVGGEVKAEVRLSETRRHAEALPDAVAGALEAAGVSMRELGAVAVGRGPGSFVGVRVAIATAKGICLARRIPLVGVGTLVALAGADEVPDGEGLGVLDARRGELYVQRVRRTPGVLVAVDEARSISPEEASGLVPASGFVVGNGLELLGGARPAGPVVAVQGPSARGLAWALVGRLKEGVSDELFSLVPAYCRAPDAKLPS